MSQLVKTSKRTTSFTIETTKKRLVLSFLKKMQLERLLIQLPQGETLIFGSEIFQLESIIKVHNETNFFNSILWHGEIGLAESYMAGDWDSPCVKNVISWFIRNRKQSELISNRDNRFSPLKSMHSLAWRKLERLTRNSLQRSKKNISAHYDLSNEMYQLFLDPSMTYSSALFLQASDTLEQAQYNKYEALLDNLNIRPGDHILEIGTGWGGLALYLVKKYGCRLTTTTISRAQFEHAQALFKTEKVADLIDLKFLDYRELEGQFDKIISIEMIEAVGEQYLDIFFKKCDELLKPQGMLAMQAIVFPHTRYEAYKDSFDFIRKHIFPGGHLPSVQRMTESLQKNGDYELYSLRDLGRDYAQTLDIWRKNFNQNLTRVIELGFDGEFVRKWNYYFEYCSAAFEEKHITVNQLLYSQANNRILNEKNS